MYNRNKKSLKQTVREKKKEEEEIAEFIIRIVNRLFKKGPVSNAVPTTAAEG